MPVHPALLANLSPEHRQLVVRGAEEESVTETEWIERAIVLRAGERGVTGQYGARREATHRRARAAGAAHEEPILEGVSAEHRDLVSAGAEEESITAKEWIERAVVLKAGHAPAHRPAASERAHPVSHAAEATRERSEEVRRESEDVETQRAAAPHHRHEEARHAEARHEPSRPERGFSSYHAHVAARAASAAEMPLDVWMEEAILERAGYRGREQARAAAPPPAPPAPAPLPPAPPPAPPPPPAPAASETVIVGGGRGGLVIGVLLGVLLAIVLILFLSWIRSGGAVAGGGGASSGGVAVASATVPVVIPGAYVWAYPGAPASQPPGYWGQPPGYWGQPPGYWGPPGPQPGPPGAAGPGGGSANAGAAGTSGAAGTAGAAGAAGAAGTAGAAGAAGTAGAAGAAGTQGQQSGPADSNSNASAGSGGRPEVVVKIIERNRIDVRAPARRPPPRRPEGGDHYGYIYDESTSQASSEYDRRDDERARAWLPDCGCDEDADDRRDRR